MIFAFSPMNQHDAERVVGQVVKSASAAFAVCAPADWLRLVPSVAVADERSG
jgi:hypothetical protein